MSMTIDTESAPAPAVAANHNGHSKSPVDDRRLVDLEARLDRRALRRDGWTIIIFSLAALALVASILAVGFATRAIGESKRNPAANLPATVMVHLSEFKIEPAVITVATGGTLQIMNMGSMPHNLSIKDAQVASPMVAAGGTGSLALAGLPAGDYTVICLVPGHEQSGMTAALHIVDKSSAGVGAPVASVTPSTVPMSAAEMDAMMAVSIKAFPAKTAGLGAQTLAPTILADGTKQFELTAKIVKWEVEPGRFVDAWTYNGTVPGPTIHVDEGDKVSVVLHNELPESTAIHFHGIITPNAMDGVPEITQPPVKPGETFTYTFIAQSTPAVGMYHSHQDAVKQVPNGLAGAFLIGEEPVPAGVTVAQPQIMMLNDAGTIGFSLNGKSFPATAPIVATLGDWVEVHYMNEGQMVHPMHLHGLTQTVIAKDGFPLPQPYDADTILIGPGERYTVIVHADNLGTWAWHCHILSHAESDKGMFGMVTAMVVQPA
jgi:FtsP/CotA-like multicopper oxidase with cupredoxin domain